MEPIAKIAQACRKVAEDIRSGRIKMKDLRRSYVFFANGACGCAFGRVLDRAGLRAKLEPYHRRTTGGGKEARWTDNCGAFEAAAGVATKDFDYADLVASGLMDLELANDNLNGEARRAQVVEALNSLAKILDGVS